MFWVTTLGAAAAFAESTPMTAEPAGGTLLEDIRRVEAHIDASPRRIMSSEDLASLRHIPDLPGHRAISPDGEHIAFELRQANSQKNDYRSEWYIAAIDGLSPPVFAGAAGPPQLLQMPDGRLNGYVAERMLRWSPDSKWIVYAKIAPPSIELWRSDLAGSTVELLIKFAGELTELEWNEDGEALMITIAGPPSTSESTNAAEAARGYLYNERFWPSMSTRPFAQPCGRTATVEMRNTNSNPCILQRWVFGLSDRQLRPETGSEKDSFRASGVAHAASSMSSHGAQARPRRLQEYAADSWFENRNTRVYQGVAPPAKVMFSSRRNRSYPIECGSPACVGHIQDVWTVADDHVVFLKLEGHASNQQSLYSWRPKTGTVLQLRHADDLLRNCMAGRHVLICVHETAVHPDSIVAVSLKTGSTRTIFDPNPEMRAIELTQVERLKWFDGFGNPTFGDLVYPSLYTRKKRFPLVIVQYRSRGFLSGGTGDEFPIHPMAAKGFFVLSFDRPDDQNGSERVPADAGDSRERYHYKRARAFTALEVVVDRLVQEGFVDPKAVGITGLSDGAETVNYALFHTHRYAAAAASTSDWSPEYRSYSNAWLRAYISKWIGGSTDYDRWKEASIGLNAELVTTPLLLQVADDELLWSLFNYNSLEDAQRPVELYVFPDEHHIKWQPSHRLAIYRRTIQWFEFWLQGVEDVNPLDSAQYARWRILRQRRNEIAGGAN